MKEKREFVLGFIGLGHMGLAIARGAVLSEAVERFQVGVYDTHCDAESKCKTESFTLLKNEKEVAEKANYVILAVPPQKLDGVLEVLKGSSIHCLVTIVAGVPIAKYESVLGNIPIIRGMPNAPLQVSQGAVALCKNEVCPADDYDFIFSLFNTMGVTRSIPEDKMCDIIAVNGSTPAYFYYFLDAMQKDLQQRGLNEDDIRALLVQTMLGTAKLIQAHPEKTMDAFLDEICTKGGTTIEAVKVMKENHMDCILSEANTKCIDRAKELGKVSENA